MPKYFGTDGFRGEAGAVLTSDHAYRIGRFLGWYYSKNNHKVRIVIGKDTRRSSYMFEYAIASGLTASGADAYMLHVTTTPSVSYVTSTDRFDCGIMISASHNPYTDNGIKLVNDFGEKMDDETLEKIEKYIDGDYESIGITEKDIPFATGENIGQIVDYSSGRNRYIAYLISLSTFSYKGLRIALDCANGSAWMIGQSVFEALGAKTYVTGNSPNGININREVGSTHIEALKRFVTENHCDVGFAFDGDADRCIAVDEQGNEINGDHIIYVLANEMKSRGMLTNNKVVTTIMSNMGLYKALRKAGIEYDQTTVGDRYVYENMIKTGNCIGGEQSGHIILKKYATTGDGILTAIQLMEAILRRKQPLSKLAEPVKMYPQVLKNIRVSSKEAVFEDEIIKNRCKEISEILGDSGRILLRKSGTEPVVRVMAEAPEIETCRKYTEEIIGLIRSRGLANE